MSYKSIPTNCLMPGMFVADLDRPWVETPFLLQGFLLESDDEITILREYCQHVTIDPEKSIGDAYAAAMAWQPEDRQHGAFQETKTYVTNPLTAMPDMQYQDVHAIEEEMGDAKTAFIATENTLIAVMERLRLGQGLNHSELQNAVVDMSASIVRNPDAMSWLLKVRQVSDYSYQHSLQVSIYLMTLGRHLGMPKEFLEQLGMTGLMLDVGNVRIPQDILNHKGRVTRQQFDIVKQHVQFGLDILNAADGVSNAVLDGVADHHERMNGSGYPRQLMGERISLFGRIAMIADVFAALTSSRHYADPVSVFLALRYINQMRGQYFHEALVEQFIQAMGVFPVGSLVELVTGEVAVVVTQNRLRRLEPRILILTKSDKTHLSVPLMQDLMYQDVSDPLSKLRIKAGLPLGSFGLDPKEHFLV
jgi:HD-GYP domain-containing protein (c-di-GMP phosphodiesterase class II)